MGGEFSLEPCWPSGNDVGAEDSPTTGLPGGLADGEVLIGPLGAEQDDTGGADADCARSLAFVDVGRHPLFSKERWLTAKHRRADDFQTFSQDGDAESARTPGV